MAKNYKLEGGQYEHPNEYKLISTARGTTILQPEFGNVIIQGGIIEAETHNIIQQNGVLTSKVTVTTEGADTVLVPTNIIAELDLADELKLMLLFETPVTLPANTFIKIKETNVPVSNIGGYSISNDTPVFFVLFDNTFFPHKVESGGGTGATETSAGIVKISTTAQVSAGTDNSTAVSPYKLKELYTSGSTKTQNGYQKLPSGVIVQWGTIDYNSNPGEIAVDVVFPSVFPTSCLNVTATRKSLANNAGDGTVGIVSYSRGSVRFQLNTWGDGDYTWGDGGASGMRGFTWFAIGY